MDGILSLHMNPLTCGVAKFNLTLGSWLELPVYQLFDPEARQLKQPLISVKPSEFKQLELSNLVRLCSHGEHRFSLMLHDYNDSAAERAIIARAERVYCPSTELFQRIAPLHPRAEEVWAPGMLSEERLLPDTDITIFSFGMAHKLQIDHYVKLQQLLQRSGASYKLLISTALHEGTTFDGRFEIALQDLATLFHGQIYFLGYLSDVAVYNHLRHATLFSAFFPKGVRGNNTSVHAAMRCGTAVITNLDEYSPPSLIHLRTMLDINRLEVLPDVAELRRVAAEGKHAAMRRDWPQLCSLLLERETVQQPPAAASVKPAQEDLALNPEELLQ